VADPKVPRAEFEFAIKALLNTPPMPMAEIVKKRKAKHSTKPKES
jgi:hypothetical protein